MIRKLALVIGATVALGTAALAPNSASAAPGWWHHGHHGHWHGFHGPRFGYGVRYVGSDCYYVKRVVATAYGPRLRRILVCD
jgi:hypothetical protein